MKEKKVGIIDYGFGNLFSVKSAIKELNHKPIISDKYKELAKCDKLILPGVGAFGDAMNCITKKKIDSTIYELVLNKKKDILGICLGFQLLGKSSNEMGTFKGLNLINFKIENLKKKKNWFIPHIGWNEVIIKENPLFKNIPNKSLFYFVHSYCAKDTKQKYVYARTNYIHQFASVIIEKNIYATQFHPEKSQKYGLKLIENFIKL